MKIGNSSILDKAVITIFALTFICAIASSFYTYYYTKNYNYLIEVSCNPESEECLYRDCESDPYSCPPNNLSYYKEYYIKAYDLPKCEDGTCESECVQGVVMCVPVI